MAGIGPKIKKVHVKVGSLFTIQGTQTQEYCAFNAASSSSPDYMADHEWIAGIHYDTAVEVGNVLEIDDGRKMLVVSLSPDLFKNSITEYKGGLFETNKIAAIHRAERTKDETGVYTVVWNTVVSNIDVVAVDSVAGRIVSEKNFGALIEHDLSLFIASVHGIKLKDRVVIDGMNYEVHGKSAFQEGGVDVCLLKKDGRE